MGSGCFKKGFGRAAPDRNQAGRPRTLLEVPDIGAYLLRQIHLVLALFNVRSIELFHVIPVENCLSGLDRGEKRLHLIEELSIQHPGFRCCGVHVVIENVPTGKDQIIQVRQRDKLLHSGRAGVSAFPQTDRSHLSQRSDRLGEALAYCLNSSDKRSGHGTHAWDHHAELAFWRLDLPAGLPRIRFCIPGPYRHLWAASL